MKCTLDRFPAHPEGGRNASGTEPDDVAVIRNYLGDTACPTYCSKRAPNRNPEQFSWRTLIPLLPELLLEKLRAMIQRFQAARDRGEDVPYADPEEI